LLTVAASCYLLAVVAKAAVNCYLMLLLAVTAIAAANCYLLLLAVAASCYLMLLLLQ